MDKIAVISDIHGNIPALEAVLKDIEDRKISRIFCLGDLAGKGPGSCETVDIIRKKCEIVVKGNWEYFISEQEDNEFEEVLWHRGILGKERLEYLKSLPLYQEFYMSGKLVRICHASPKDVLKRVHASASYVEKAELFEAPEDSELDSDVIIYGDIHGAYSQCFDQKMIFNVGSVGNPLEFTLASYGIIEGSYKSLEEGAFSISIVRVPYDIELAVQYAIEKKIPDLEHYINELRTGVYRGKKK
ncbi:metallophosphoesterase family protein [Ilyobacter polytropus]|uniref:Metallophosphoesterase n=1 Tax=Ilyobacter polytropus (strain ATCC 51220 / DSM 2926 / LMG 16218 / CuHBu1) TaxID=572544 RepID=E3HBX7_ILYPC|nr:metallophosphoesterase family protein [Ilyobacter polytropus]ADO84303.1 metallophosphoesterase [Ilyobacter polytropus DSM 2926]